MHILSRNERNFNHLRFAFLAVRRSKNYLPQCSLELVLSYSKRIVRRRAKGDWKVTRSDIKEFLEKDERRRLETPTKILRKGEGEAGKLPLRAHLF